MQKSGAENTITPLYKSKNPNIGEQHDAKIHKKNDTKTKKNIPIWKTKN